MSTLLEAFVDGTTNTHQILLELIIATLITTSDWYCRDRVGYNERWTQYRGKCESYLHEDQHLQGVLRGFDQLTNVIMENCHERVYSASGVEQVMLGLYIIRGDNV